MSRAVATCSCPAAGQVRGRGGPQAGQARLGAQRSLVQRRGALVEEHRMDALHPGGVLTPQVMVSLQQRPVLQDLRRRDPAFGQPPLGQQRPEVPGVGLVGLGMPLAATQRGGAGRLAQMRGNPGRGQLLGDIPPPGTPLHRERHLATAGEPRQPGPHVLPVRRGDLPAPDLTGHGVEIVEGDLLPVNIQPAYDRHRDLLTLPRAPQAPHTRMAYESIVTRLSWGGPRRANHRHVKSDAHADPPMHVI
jgi:hypothetical protein